MNIHIPSMKSGIANQIAFLWYDGKKQEYDLIDRTVIG